MKTAICQLEIIWEDKAANLKKAAAFLESAAAQGAELILFPEMSLTGFSMHTERTAEQPDETGFGESVRQMSELARRAHIAAGLGWVKSVVQSDNLTETSIEKSGIQKAENHYTIIGPDGMVLADYTKMHPFGFAGEDLYFSSGTSLEIFEAAGRRCSCFICYDLRFPEIFQAVSAEAEIIFVPANWPARRREHWNSLLKARAIENQVYMLGINCVGEQEGQRYCGDSQIIAPTGEVIAFLSEQEGLLLCEIPDDVAGIRADFPVRRDRKPDLYAEFLQKGDCNSSGRTYSN